MLVGYQGHFLYILRLVIAIKPMPWTKTASLYNQKRYSYCIWIFWPILAQLGPILAHFVTGVGLSNLTVMITFKNVLRAKVAGFYFSKLAVWARFGPDLAKVWPRFGPSSVHLTHFVTGVVSDRNSVSAESIGRNHWYRFRSRNLFSRNRNCIILHFSWVANKNKKKKKREKKK